ncbi:hypothetical protein [Ralstonia pseudosolanacearum]|uniref:hypothetical protein n=1 Tax=Ralstonia pseudosolanacearum TaxID=1310165 RepID=UPI00397E06CD
MQRRQINVIPPIQFIIDMRGVIHCQNSLSRSARRRAQRPAQDARGVKGKIGNRKPAGIFTAALENRSVSPSCYDGLSASRPCDAGSS